MPDPGSCAWLSGGRNKQAHGDGRGRAASEPGHGPITGGKRPGDQNPRFSPTRKTLKSVIMGRWRTMVVMRQMLEGWVQS